MNSTNTYDCVGKTHEIVLKMINHENVYQKDAKVISVEKILIGNVSELVKECPLFEKSGLSPEDRIPFSAIPTFKN